MNDMFKDIREFCQAKKDSIIKFDAKSSPFSVMIVVQFKKEIFVEYQIKIKTGEEGNE